MEIRYALKFADGSATALAVVLDDVTLERRLEPRAAPDWTRLGFHQCPNCPLRPETSPTCPLALSLVDVIEAFGGHASIEPVDVEVSTVERRVLHRTTLQRALGSLMGVIMATSGCPRTAYFRPMARFHLPFATEAETVYRAASMYALAGFFIARHGGTPDTGFDGLMRIYREIQTVNQAVAGRLRAAVTQDASINAVVLLEMLARGVPYSIEDALVELEPLYGAYLGGEPDA